MMSLAADFEMNLKGIVRSDSTVAIGIAHREGLGAADHLHLADALCDLRLLVDAEGEAVPGRKASETRRQGEREISEAG